MEKMDETILSLCRGEKVEVEFVDVICDNAAEFVPIAKKNMGYIVGGVVFNEEGEVLMMQEAKKSCYGKWYLPMGRLEPGETFQEGAIREVLEETGIFAEPSSILLAQLGGVTWFRYIFIMKQTGGQLKTTPDAESLKADWMPPDKVLNKELPIRGNDILPVIKCGLDYRERSTSDNYCIMPVIQQHKQLIHRMLHVAVTTEGDYAILINTFRHVHLPCCLMGPEDMTLMVSVFRLFQDAFSRKLQERPVVLGILSVEHCGKPASKNDGMCVTTLMHTQKLLKLEGVNKKNYDWHVVVNPELISKLQLMLQGKGILPFVDVHSKT